MKIIEIGSYSFKGYTDKNEKHKTALQDNNYSMYNDQGTLERQLINLLNRYNIDDIRKTLNKINRENKEVNAA